jgi:hypothetical protein
MLRRTILLVGYLMIFAAAMVGVVDGTRWIANDVFSFTPVAAVMRQVGFVPTDQDWTLLPALPSFLVLGVTFALSAIVMLGTTPSEHPSIHDR